MKLNNKGQSLVMFVVLIPLFLLVLAVVIDIGNLVVNKLDLASVNKLVVSYGIDNIDKDNLDIELRKLIDKNYKDVDNVSINIDDNRIVITLKDYSKSIFSNIVGSNGYLIESKYRGYIDNGKKIIEKVK